MSAVILPAGVPWKERHDRALAAGVPAFRWWQPTVLRRKRLEVLIAAEPDIWKRGYLLDALADTYPRIVLRPGFEPRNWCVGATWSHTAEWDGGWWENWITTLRLLPTLTLTLTVDRSNRYT